MSSSQGTSRREPLTDAEKYRTVELKNRIYASRDGGVGCCWHIVLSDGNITDNCVAYCIEHAEHPDCIELGPLVQRMSRTQREKLIRDGYRGMIAAMDSK